MQDPLFDVEGAEPPNMIVDEDQLAILLLAAQTLDYNGDLLPVPVDTFFTFASQRNVDLIEHALTKFDLENLTQEDLLGLLSFVGLAALTDGFALAYQLSKLDGLKTLADYNQEVPE